MTLIKSISGIRGTIGGKVGDNLTPVDAVKFASAYGTFLKQNSSKEKLKVVEETAKIFEKTKTCLVIIICCFLYCFFKHFFASFLIKYNLNM